MRFTIVIHILSISRALYKAITPAINFSVDLIVVWNDVRKKWKYIRPQAFLHVYDAIPYYADE